MGALITLEQIFALCDDPVEYPVKGGLPWTVAKDENFTEINAIGLE